MPGQLTKVVTGTQPSQEGTARMADLSVGVRKEAFRRAGGDVSKIADAIARPNPVYGAKLHGHLMERSSCTMEFARSSGFGSVEPAESPFLRSEEKWKAAQTR